MTITRTDVHRPSSPDFNPELYVCRGVWDMNPEYPNPAAVQRRLAVVNELIDAGYRFGPGDSHQCGHCGAHIRYAALMVREDVHEMIYVGETCLNETFSMDLPEFKAVREAAAAARKLGVKKMAIAALVDEHPALAWATYPDTLWGMGEFVVDIASKLRAYGELSERQIAAFEKALERETEKADRAAAREAERAAKVEAGVTCPAGKVTVAGTVVWEGWKDGYYGAQHKMIVESAEGWKVYVTVPAKVEDQVEKGVAIQFEATVTVKDDPVFGFAARPAKVKVG